MAGRAASRSRRASGRRGRSLVFGGDGIVFFDPFWFEVTVYASIGAGVTIDVWIGEITISVSLSARVDVDRAAVPRPGARSRSARSTSTVEFGDRATEPHRHPVGRVRPPSTSRRPRPARRASSPRHRQGRRAAGRVVEHRRRARRPTAATRRRSASSPEFEFTVTSTAPVRALVAGGATPRPPDEPGVSVAPMGALRQASRSRCTSTGRRRRVGRSRSRGCRPMPQQLGAFAIGTWGPAQDATTRRCRAATCIAGDRSRSSCARRRRASRRQRAGRSSYRQVETGPAAAAAVRRRDTTSAASRAADGDGRCSPTLIPAAAGSAARSPSRADAARRARRARAAADRHRVAPAIGRGTAPRLARRRPRRRTGAVDGRPTVPPAPAAAPAPPRPPRVRALLSAPEAGASLTGAPIAGPSSRRSHRGHDRSERARGASCARRRLAGAVGSPPSTRGLDAAMPARLLRLADAAADIRPTPPSSRPWRRRLTRTVTAGRRDRVGPRDRCRLARSAGGLRAARCAEGRDRARAAGGARGRPSPRRCRRSRRPRAARCRTRRRPLAPAPASWSRRRVRPRRRAGSRQRRRRRRSVSSPMRRGKPGAAVIRAGDALAGRDRPSPRAWPRTTRPMCPAGSPTAPLPYRRRTACSSAPACVVALVRPRAEPPRPRRCLRAGSRPTHSSPARAPSSRRSPPASVVAVALEGGHADRTTSRSALAGARAPGGPDGAPDRRRSLVADGAARRLDLRDRARARRRPRGRRDHRHRPSAAGAGSPASRRYSGTARDRSRSGRRRSPRVGLRRPASPPRRRAEPGLGARRSSRGRRTDVADAATARHVPA